MPVAQRRADVTWEGNLAQGSGRLKLASAACDELPVSWAARAERPDGKTSPEELMAAAHASCFAMAFSNALAERGSAPTRLHVSAVCTLDRVGSGLKVTAIDLDVRGEVAGIDAATFSQVAQEAEKHCPVSNAIRNNVEIRLKAALERAA